MKKNTAGQHIDFQQILVASGLPATGLSAAIDVTVEIDGAGENPGAGGFAEQSNGGYKYLVTQAETNGYHIAFSFYNATTIAQRFNIYTTEVLDTKMPTTHIDATDGQVDGVALVDTTTANTDMRGTDNAREYDVAETKTHGTSGDTLPQTVTKDA